MFALHNFKNALSDKLSYKSVMSIKQNKKRLQVSAVSLPRA